MNGPYRRDGRALLVDFPNGTADTVGTITGADLDGTVALVNRAAREQDRRHYTASARLYARADPSIEWTEPEDDDVEESHAFADWAELHSEPSEWAERKGY